MALTTTSVTLNATNEWLNTGISITSGQQLIISASGFVKPWGHWPNPGIDPNGDPTWPTPPESGVHVPNAPFCILIGRIDTGVAFPIGAYRNLSNLQAQGYSGTLYLAINDVAGNFGDNSGSFSVQIKTGTLEAMDHEPPVAGDRTCYTRTPSSVGIVNGPAHGPVHLLLREKREQVTDLSINTPAGPLEFSRVYRQHKLEDDDYRFMGLGWSHNHISKLTLSGSSPDRVAEVLLPGGGYLKLEEDTMDHFEATAGSSSVLDYDSGEDAYILTAQDKSQLIFDDTSFQLIRRTWPSGESWEYSYSSGQLISVADTAYDLDPGGSTVYRGLQFSYIDNPGQFDDGQLWRVGDHTASGLDGGSPSGRYIEFTYVPERDDGVLVSTPKALLATVSDVRNPNNTWAYDWYGQDSGEDATEQLNFLVQVDPPGGVITRKQVSYEMSGSEITAIIQAMGIQGMNPALLDVRYDFETDVTEATIGGKVSEYHILGGVASGVSDPAGNRQSYWLGEHYRPDSQIDANGNETTLRWDTSGKFLEKVTDGLGNETTFNYDTNDELLLDSTDAEGRKTEYTYDDSNNPRLPTEVKVYDSAGTTLLRFQKFTYDSKGRTLTEQVIDPVDEMTMLQEVERAYYSSGVGNGLLHTVTQTDIGGSDDVTTTYTYDAFGRVVKTQQSSNFGSCEISYTIYDEAGNVVASICNYDPGANPDPTDAIEAVALYDEQEPDVNRVTTHEYDAMGRRVKTTVNAGASFVQTTVTVYDALDRVVRTIQNFVDDSYAAPGEWVFENGVWKDGPGGTAIAHGTDNTKNIIADTAYNDRGLVRLQRDVLGNVTLLGYNDAGRLVKTIQSASDPDYNNNYSGTSPDSDLSNYTPVSDADQDIITKQVYDPAGNLVQTTDPLGRVTFTIYDALNRSVKTVRNAKAEATIALNPGDMGYDEADDPRSENYAPSVDPDRDQIEMTEYDAMGRVIRSQRLLENRGAEAVWDTTLYGYDTLGRQIKTVRSASNANYDVAADPDLSAYTSSGEPDEDIITQTVYDDNGRTLYTQDALGIRTWIGYDGLGRGIKTIQSAIGTDTDGGSGDPRSASYSPSSEPDEDLITRTVYNDDGRVQETEDVLGNVTYFVYDGVGRQVRTIRNYVAQGATDPADWEWSIANDRWEDGATNAIDHGTDNDQNILSETMYDAQGRVESTFDHRHNEMRYEYDLLGRRVQTIQNYGDGTFSAGTPDEDIISTTEYDVAGRVIVTTDNAGVETRFEYDALGRRVKTIQNYVDGVFSSANSDEDLISTTEYNKAGQVISTSDPRGTQTTFTYDVAGRRLTIIQAAGTSLATVSYTCYDKAGRVRRTIQNWIDDETSPDAQDGSGGWLFAPTVHGQYNDENLITEYRYDAASRREKVVDPVGNETTTTYDKGGQVVTITDAEAVDTAYRYDKVRRRTWVVQNFVDNGEDPSAWVWDSVTDERWEESDGTAIVHGSDNDQNIIVQVGYDKAGRMLSLRDPNGNETTYEYDQLGRRLALTNPLSIAWETAYSNLANGGTQTIQTLPGINGGSSYNVTRDFDRLGRLSSIQYGDPASTPDIAFGYDAAGNRVQMTEYGGAGFTSPVRETTYGYDDVRRLTSVGFDHDADSSVDETVSYEYDAGGLRTKLTLPGGTDSIVYVYNAKGELVSLTDWDDGETRFAYDNAGRHIATIRGNGLRSRYRYDPASRLRTLRHTNGQLVLGHFDYLVDGRGNRTQALEVLPHPATTSDVTLNWDDEGVVYQGSWSDDNTNGFKESTSISAKMQTLFFGNTATLTFGVGPDHGLFDVYIGKTLWQSFDGYAASPGTEMVDIPLDASGGKRLAHEGPHLFEIRNRVDRNGASSGNKVRFKQLVMVDVAYDLHTIQYAYDGLSRLLSADLYPGHNVNATPLREYAYSYDLAGNRLSESLALNGGGPTVTNFSSYNGANQIGEIAISGDPNSPYTPVYDASGNLTDDGMGNTLTWDRANRLLSMGGHAYAYDGLGQRIRQTVGAAVTQYLLDVQPQLAQVIASTTGMDTERYVHGPRGIHAMQDVSGNWIYAGQDALGNVRSEVNENLAVLGTRHLAPYLTPFGEVGSFAMPFVATGEITDGNDLVYLRNRYLSPNLGTFLSLDLIETLNRYTYASDNPVNRRDPSGLQDVPIPVPPIPCIPGINCPGDLSPIIPGIGHSGDLPIGSEIKESGQRRRDEECEEGKRRNEEGECVVIEDENEACGCNTNWLPQSMRAFSSGIVGSPADDMLCNLRCYGGQGFEGIYRFFLQPKGVRIDVIARHQGGTRGAFLPPRQQVMAQSQLNDLFQQIPGASFPDVVPVDDDIAYRHRIHNQTGGGMIFIRQPGGGATRANRLATLVEEIAHAVNYHGPLCQRLTPYENEIIAKLSKAIWMGSSGLPFSLFAAQLAEDVLQLANTPRTGQAFRNCPGTGQAGSILISTGCVDPMVTYHLV